MEKRDNKRLQELRRRNVKAMNKMGEVPSDKRNEKKINIEEVNSLDLMRRKMLHLACERRVKFNVLRCNSAIEIIEMRKTTENFKAYLRENRSSFASNESIEEIKRYTEEIARFEMRIREYHFKTNALLKLDIRNKETLVTVTEGEIAFAPHVLSELRSFEEGDIIRLDRKTTNGLRVLCKELTLVERQLKKAEK